MYSTRSDAARRTINLIAGVLVLGNALFLVGCGDDDCATCPDAPGAVLLAFNFENFAEDQETGAGFLCGCVAGFVL